MRLLGTAEEWDGDTIRSLDSSDSIIITDMRLPEISVIEDGSDRLLVFKEDDRAATIRIADGSIENFVLTSFQNNGAGGTEGEGGTVVFVSTQNSRQTVLYGGDDRIIARENVDDLFFYAEGGDDFVATGEGPDYLSGGAGNDVLDGGGSRDLIHGGPGINVVTGGEGDDDYYFDIKDFTEPTGDPDQPWDVKVIADYASGEDIFFYGFGSETAVERESAIIRLNTGTLILMENDHRGVFLQDYIGFVSTSDLLFDVALGTRKALRVGVDPNIRATSSTIVSLGDEDKVYNGEAGDDQFTTGGGNDALFGFAGDDTLILSLHITFHRW